jgi:phosphoribosylformylglycinamidine (FGAM) synthase-like amidotransferase family enzyme
MPHPERAADALLGSEDGMLVLRSLVESAAARSGMIPGGVAG